MNKLLTSAALVACTVALLTGCAETRDPDDTGIGFHPADWAKPGSDENHFAALAEQGLPNSTQECAGCHGADYGKGANTDCFECHAIEIGEQGHPAAGFISPAGPDFHGQDVIDEIGTDRCASCHSFEFDGQLDFDVGGWSQQACNVCHAGGRSGHPASSVWFDPASPRFHGAAAGGVAITHCGECHGADFLGGWTGVSCNTCHSSVAIPIHPATWVGSGTTPGTHAYFITEEPGFIETCSGCHGADYLGGWAEVSCNTCHSSVAIPIHPDTWVGLITTPGTHGYLLTAQSPATEPELMLDTCRACHGADFSGGWAEQDCSACHPF